jgi:hypothetical protein
MESSRSWSEALKDRDVFKLAQMKQREFEIRA